MKHIQGNLPAASQPGVVDLYWIPLGAGAHVVRSWNRETIETWAREDWWGKFRWRDSDQQ